MTAGKEGSGVGVSVGDGGGNSSPGDGGGRRQWIMINATIFLPISEGAFVDDNGPLLARYQEANNHTKGVHCKMDSELHYCCLSCY